MFCSDILLEKMACRSVPLNDLRARFSHDRTDFPKILQLYIHLIRIFTGLEVPRYRSDDDCTRFKKTLRGVSLYSDFYISSQKNAGFSALLFTSHFIFKGMDLPCYFHLIIQIVLNLQSLSVYLDLPFFRLYPDQLSCIF